MIFATRCHAQMAQHGLKRHKFTHNFLYYKILLRILRINFSRRFKFTIKRPVLL